MGHLEREFSTGRHEMIEAFIELSTMARRAGVDPDAITLAHGQFFDGHVMIKRAFGGASILARFAHDGLA